MLDRPDPATAAALARLYDLDLQDDPGDLDLYLALGDRADGRILELAAGSGRLAVPLALAGHPVTAVDIDRAMLDRGRAHATATGVPPDRAGLCRSGPARCPAAGCRHLRARVHRPQLDHAARRPRRPATGVRDAGGASRARRPGRRGRLATGRRRPRPIRRAGDPRVAANGPGHRCRGHEGWIRPARRGDEHGRADRHLRGRPPGRSAATLGPARSAAARSRPTSSRPSPRTPDSTSRSSPADTTCTRSRRARNAPSSSPNGGSRPGPPSGARARTVG